MLLRFPRYYTFELERRLPIADFGKTQVTPHVFQKVC
jgi:hypothetical protein